MQIPMKTRAARPAPAYGPVSDGPVSALDGSMSGPGGPVPGPGGPVPGGSAPGGRVPGGRAPAPAPESPYPAGYARLGPLLAAEAAAEALPGGAFEAADLEQAVWLRLLELGGPPADL